MMQKHALSAKARQRGAIALEYILIAALVAIALIGTFVYFRGTLKESGKAISDTTKNAVEESIKTGTTVDKVGSIEAGTVDGK